MKINPVNRAMGRGKMMDLNRNKAPASNKSVNSIDKVILSSSSEKVITYNKQAVRTEQNTLAALKKESERAYESLRRIVT